ncbi:MAG: HipA domain-containing protein [Candidatus Caenarcaniphilales bacterium]|nr:HipA domain-containing protein [Candidatus Caenarcaniphilales bacterium]
MQEDDKVVDITDWNKESVFLHDTRHPKGLQDKHVILNPDDNQKYFYKDTWRKNHAGYQSVESQQFWIEYIANKLAEGMGLDVPECYIAINNSPEIAFRVGVLSKWYLSSQEQEISGRDFLSKNIPNYREGYIGESENNNRLYTLSNIIEATSHIPESQNHWIKLLLFDALIGNTDRHDENWGIIISDGKSRFTPIYDNGIALGWREKDDKLAKFNFETFFRKFKYKLRLNEESLLKPADLIGLYEKEKDQMKEFLRQYNRDYLNSWLNRALYDLNSSITEEESRLSPLRAEFICRFLEDRFKRLSEEPIK